VTIELVDGRAGTAHISSEDKAIIHQAKFGSADMVYGWGDAMSCTMSSTTKAVIGTGCASIQGLDWHITAAETVTIANGTQGMKRNDIIAAHYHRDSSTGVETVALTVLKGTPNATAAADPTVPSGKILDGATDAYQSLWRIPLDGITVGTPVCLYNRRTALWDSVTHTCRLKFQNTSSFVESQYSGGNEITVKDGLIFVDLASFKSAVALSTGYQVWLRSSGVRPSERIVIGGIANVAGKSGGKQVTWNTDGSVTLNGGLSNGDVIHCYQKTIPVPDGVTFS
jgi:hypothetical protein